MDQRSNIISLRGFRAHDRYRRYRQLPEVLRTRERTVRVLDAIFAYAYEGARTVRQPPAGRERFVGTREICRRLEEFTRDSQAGCGPVMEWLHDNMLPEAWLSEEHLRDFVEDCLRHG